MRVSKKDRRKMLKQYRDHHEFRSYEFPLEERISKVHGTAFSTTLTFEWVWKSEEARECWLSIARTLGVD